MTRSRVSGSRLSSALPLSTRETVDACTFAARATSVIVTRLAANVHLPGRKSIVSTIRPRLDVGSWARRQSSGRWTCLAVDLPAQPIRRENVDVATCDADQTAVLEIGEDLVDGHARRAHCSSQLVLRESERMRVGLSAA